MKFREAGTIILVVFISVCGLYTLAHKVKNGWVKEDNFVEEYVEHVIQDQTGIKLDLTPSDETGGFFQGVDLERLRERFAFEDDED